MDSKLKAACFEDFIEGMTMAVDQHEHHKLGFAFDDEDPDFAVIHCGTCDCPVIMGDRSAVEFFWLNADGWRKIH